jgi:UTP:GlnB (protein PII) uridylyltransferase
MSTSADYVHDNELALIEHLMNSELVGAVTSIVRTKLSDITLENCSLLLAAHIVDVVADGGSPDTSLLQYSFPPHVANEATSLVHASTLLRSALTANETDTNQRLLAQLAAYLGTPLMVEWCRILTSSRGTSTHNELNEDQYFALLTVTTGVQAVLAHPELIEGNDASLDALRRREAKELTIDPLAQTRIDTAPSTYILSHQPSDIARHVNLAEPAIDINCVRVRVYETHVHGEWLIDVVTHDMKGLLARITAIFSENHMDIMNADLATWPDGTVIDTFIVACDEKPDERGIARMIENSFTTEMSLTPSTHHFSVRYDDNVLPWHTVVTVTGRDEPGALHDIAAAFAAADISVHHAHLSGDGLIMTDRFEVTDSLNKHISDEQRARFEALLNGH